ncbi:hypothetical protein Thermo_02040 [Thermoplasmatales archaeon]|nr:hypothetical protein Thermo_02040 [Thermoplasmatales archaeon]
MLKYLYIDESGDLGFSHGSSDVLVISALLVNDQRKLYRIIKNLRRNKYSSELKGARELKANSSSPAIRRSVIEKLNEIDDAKAFHIILVKERLQNRNLKEHKDKLYNYIAGILADGIIIDGYDLEVRIDKSKGKQFLRDDFNQYFEKHIRKDSTIGKLSIYHSSSESFSGIQFADFLAWSVFQKYNWYNCEYINLLNFTNSYNVFPGRKEDKTKWC